MARRYRLEDKPDEELENERPDDELEREEDEHSASDEDEDARAEDDDLEEEADDEDDDAQASDEDETKSKKAKHSRLSERARCAGLMRLEKTAKRLGVKFDAARAIANGLNLNLARSRILTAAANADQGRSISPHIGRKERNFGNVSQSQARSLWKQAKKSRGKR